MKSWLSSNSSNINPKSSFDIFGSVLQTKHGIQADIEKLNPQTSYPESAEPKMLWVLKTRNSMCSFPHSIFNSKQYCITLMPLSVFHLDRVWGWGINFIVFAVWTMKPYPCNKHKGQSWHSLVCKYHKQVWDKKQPHMTRRTISNKLILFTRQQ